MSPAAPDVSLTHHELRQRRLPAGDARCAVFTRTYDAGIEDVWDACTDPERLRRWYAPVAGDLHLGGTFTQGDFGQGTVVRCVAPSMLTVHLGGGDPVTDQIELRLRSNGDGTTVLEFEHATTLDSHEIGGEIYDAVYCMGGGYGPRLITLQQHLDGTLADDVDVSGLHLRDDMGPAIQTSMRELATLLGTASRV